MSESFDQDQRKSRIVKSTFNVILGSILFAITLIGVYWLASNSHQRIDLTRNNMYSLSSSSKDLLKKLEDRVSVTVYATEEDTPPEWTERREELRELLTEYRNLSDGKVQFSFIDVSPGTDSEKAARDAGMEPSLMQQASATELKFNQGYLGLTAEYRGETETIPFLAGGQSLEYQLSRVINKVAAIDIPTVALVAPGGNPLMGQQSQFSVLSRELEAEGFEVQEMQAEEIKSLEDIDLLMLIDPQNLGEEVLFRIDQFVMNGGKLFVAAPGVQLNSRMGMNSVVPNPPNINSVLEHYGLRVNPNLVEDWQGGRQQAAITRSGTLVQYKDPLVFTTSQMTEKSELTKNIPTMMFAYSSSVGPSDLGTSGTLTPLITTSDNARLQSGGQFTLEPTELRPPAPEEQTSAQDLVMMVEGSLTSRYATEAAPPLTNDDGTTRAVADDEILKKSQNEPQVVVAGSALMLVDQAVQAMPANILLPLNIAEGFTRGSDILALRARDMGVPQLREITPAEARWTQILIIGGIPLLLIIFGFVKMWMNRRRRARYRRVYTNSTE